jgi:type IV secretory pathway component VirB8
MNGKWDKLISCLDSCNTKNFGQCVACIENSKDVRNKCFSCKNLQENFYDTSRKKRKKLGLIIGLSVGGGVLLIIIVIFLLRFRK